MTAKMNLQMSLREAMSARPDGTAAHGCGAGGRARGAYLAVRGMVSARASLEGVGARAGAAR